ncbi:Anti-sigma regulatory factor (Ser/Thr protein kinase) [Blastococcus aurantiacus]|uniref:Anti-sigma regulatory factor (Ser/Thr protein kinase) n=1 Tax=Blastococcus aurantiacus TaxID=1550231 RepID=A0A1G7HCY4_9ACTN|nr:anti-sigma factor RsbA family regulatory protein [Blastococcus aurantiacus]SDE98310.1 Anti-sigma regulatory factor (Ser/Thr protein kinase) [Blastococcus aurantiacus]
MSTRGSSATAPTAFTHEVLLYRDDATFLAGLLPFLHEGLAFDEEVVVAEPPDRQELLRTALGPAAAAVRWLDVTELGRNPGRLIDACTTLLAEATAAGRRLRGVGESAWPGRHDAEYAECRLHELLLGTAFADGPPWRLLCPYDQVRLPRDVRTGALLSHPLVATPTGGRPSTSFSPDAAAADFGTPLPPPHEGVLRGTYGPEDLRPTRRTVASFARSCGLSVERSEALELAAAELATNSVRHGGGSGSLAMWRTDDAAVVEFSDRGQLTEPLAGRRPPGAERSGGWGLYLVNQLCDLVQVRSGSWGTTVRVTTWR